MSLFLPILTAIRNHYNFLFKSSKCGRIPTWIIKYHPQFPWKECLKTALPFKRPYLLKIQSPLFHLAPLHKMTEALQKGQKRYSLCFKTKHIPNFNLSGFIVQENILNSRNVVFVLPICPSLFSNVVWENRATLIKVCFFVYVAI